MLHLAGRLSSQPGSGALAVVYELNPMIGVIDGFRSALPRRMPFDRPIASLPGVSLSCCWSACGISTAPSERFADIDLKIDA